MSCKEVLTFWLDMGAPISLLSHIGWRRPPNCRTARQGRPAPSRPAHGPLASGRVHRCQGVLERRQQAPCLLVILLVRMVMVRVGAAVHLVDRLAHRRLVGEG